MWKIEGAYYALSNRNKIKRKRKKGKKNYFFFPIIAHAAIKIIIMITTIMPTYSSVFELPDAACATVVVGAIVDAATVVATVVVLTVDVTDVVTAPP